MAKVKAREIAREAMQDFPIAPIQRLKKDQRAAALSLSHTEIRYLVDLYYQLQEFRKASGNQIVTMDKGGEPSTLLNWLFVNFDNLEAEIKTWMDIYTDGEPTGMGAWAKGICGIGPILSAGLLAHVDITKCPTVSHLWSFGGWNPDQKWEKGKKRPFNASLKVLFWKIGESFVKQQANKNDRYGRVYAERKAYEWAKNLRGEYSDQARAKLSGFNLGKNTDAYRWYSGRLLVPEGTRYTGEIPSLPAAIDEEGVQMLPPARIQLRAQRYAAKLFLAHWWETYYRHHFGQAPPAPYPIAFLNHAHYIPPPGQEEEAKAS